MFFSICKNGDCTTSLGNLCQRSVTLTVQKYFMMFRGNFLCFSLGLFPLVLSLGTTEKSLAQPSLQPLFRYIYALMRSFSILLFSRLNSYSFLSLSSQEGCSSSSWGSFVGSSSVCP